MMNQESEPRRAMLPPEYCRIGETKSSWSRRIARKSTFDYDTTNSTGIIVVSEIVFRWVILRVQVYYAMPLSAESYDVPVSVT
jgi:hypothetical protein